MKTIIILVFLFFISQIHFAISQPKIPSIPKIPDISQKLNKIPGQKGKQQTEKKNIVYHKYKVKVILNKGSQTTGNIKIPQNYIMVSQRENDFVFQKKLEIKDIKRLEILMWKEAKLSSKKDNKKEIKHLFYPIKWNILTQSGKYIVYNGRLKVFEKFVLNGTLGKAGVYSIFYDYWKIEGKGGMWLNSKSRKFKYNRLNPNPLTLKEIQFKHEK